MDAKTVTRIIVGVIIALLLIVCIVLGFVLSNCHKNCQTSSFRGGYVPANSLESRAIEWGHEDRGRGGLGLGGAD